MARYYQTADREYLDDGIYMPPVELMSKVIAAKDAELDKDIADINMIKDVAGTNIKYWADVDKEQAEALKNEYNTDVNNLTQYIMENPLSKDIKGRINDLQTRINLDLQQGGRIDALAQNLAAYQKATEAFGKLKDQDYAQATLNYDLQNYKYEKGDTPTAEGNYFNPGKYANPVENVDMFGEVAKVVKDIVPKETGGYYYSKKTGEKIMTETGQRTKQRIEDVTLEALMNAAPEWRAKMLNDDKIGWNGSGNTWYIYDENGNPIDINKDSSVVKNLIKQEQDVYFKDDKKVKSEIIDEDLFERHYGITKGKKPKDEDHYYLQANFLSDSDIYRNAASRAYAAYMKDGGRAITIVDDNNQLTGLIMGWDGRIQKIIYEKDANGNRRIKKDSRGLAVTKPLSDKEWEAFGDKFHTARTQEKDNPYRTTIKDSDGRTTNKYLGEYYNDQIQNISADKKTFEKVKNSIFNQNDISISGSNLDSYSVGSRPKFNINTLNTLGDFVRVGAKIQKLDENGNFTDVEANNSTQVTNKELVFVSVPTDAGVGEIGNYQATVKLSTKDGSPYYVVLDVPVHRGTGGENIYKGGLE